MFTYSLDFSTQHILELNFGTFWHHSVQLYSYVKDSYSCLCSGPPVNATLNHTRGFPKTPTITSQHPSAFHFSFPYH